MRFNQYNSLGLVLRALDYIRYPNQNGRRVDLGMNAALRYFFNRRNKYFFIQKILVVVVSGRQTHRSYYLMGRLRLQFAKLGVKVYIVGVGHLDYRYLRPITYKNRHMYTVRSYRSLVTRAGQIAKAIHNEMRITRDKYRDMLARLDSRRNHGFNRSEEDWEQVTDTNTEPSNQTEPEDETTFHKPHEAFGGPPVNSTGENWEQGKQTSQSSNELQSEYQGSLVQPQESNGPRSNSTEDDMERNINSTVTDVPNQINGMELESDVSANSFQESKSQWSSGNEEDLGRNVNSTLTDIPEKVSPLEPESDVSAASSRKHKSQRPNSTVEDLGRNIDSTVTELENDVTVSIPHESEGPQLNSAEVDMGPKISNTTSADVPEKGNETESVDIASPTTNPPKMVDQRADLRPKRNGTMKEFTHRRNGTDFEDISNLAKIHEMHGQGPNGTVEDWGRNGTTMNHLFDQRNGTELENIV